VARPAPVRSDDAVSHRVRTELLNYWERFPQILSEVEDAERAAGNLQPRDLLSVTASRRLALSVSAGHRFISSPIAESLSTRFSDAPSRIEEH
jgi:hypothetical protein